MSQPIDPSLRPLDVNGPNRIGGGAKRPESGEEPRGPAFQVLLDKLQAQARELQDRSKTVERPEDLAEAARHAQDSLEAALSFGDRLLEAYRERLQNGPAEPPADGAPGEGKGT